MKKIAAAFAAVIMAVSVTACSAKGEDNGSSAVKTEAQTNASDESKAENSSKTELNVETLDNSECTELIDCIKTQLQAAKDGDYESFKKAMSYDLMAELAAEQMGDTSAELMTEEQSDEMIRKLFDMISQTAGSYDGELDDLVVQADKEQMYSVSVYSVSFMAGGAKYYAFAYSKDGRYGAALENDVSINKPMEEKVQGIADNNARIIGNAAEAAAEKFGKLADGSYTFDIRELAAIESPDNALDAIKSAVAESFAFDPSVNEGQMFLLIKNGKVYAQWKSPDEEQPIIGEYPAHEGDYTPIWQQPDTAGR